MVAEDSEGPREPGGPRWFATTHWSVVVAAAAEQRSPESLTALGQLCRTYWYPLYAYARRQGHPAADAEDFTQGFFARLIEKRSLIGLNRDGGKFRSYLLTSFKHFLVNEWEHARTVRRGGGKELSSLDARDLEGRFQLEPVDQSTPEALYERRWALAALEEVLVRLQREYAATERADVFDRLRGFLVGDRPPATYAEVAAECGTTEGAVKVAVFRLRRRYGELLREEIARTVSRPGEVEEEIRHLISILAHASSAGSW